VDRVHRKELKHDRFVEQVGHTVEYAAEHRQQLVRYALGVIAVIAIGAGIYFYRDHQHSVRQVELRQALRTQDAQVSPPDPNGIFVTFPTAAEKDKATENAWKELATRYSGTDEGQIAKFYLGTYYVDHGNNTEAEKYFKEAADGGDKAFASQAKFSLADLYAANGRRADAEKLLRELMNNPTVMVSKEQAQIELARVLATSNPGEARKLLEPLRTQGGGVGRIALSALAEIPAAR
jgi:lipoprotein NlpI